MTCKVPSEMQVSLSALYTGRSAKEVDLWPSYNGVLISIELNGGVLQVGSEKKLFAVPDLWGNG